MTRKLIWVRWRDASLHLKEIHAGQVEEYEPCTVVESCGHLVGETDGAILLAIDWMEQQQKWRTISSIPKVNIIKRRVVKIEI